MGKKKYVSSKVILRSMTASRRYHDTSRSHLLIIVGLMLFFIGWLMIAHPDWIINTLIDRLDFLIN
ncbi:MAG: hypothetical protein GF384_02170 [Elusimicrobia bacterium]|nr:hypothetical protein [Elusimicrobiota bacterium]MBD3411785.1 hypothetical protein [Elusimicrobiota bacterium]